jgi:predicted metal-dependent HD superfamily phosphohydrolase
MDSIEDPVVKTRDYLTARWAETLKLVGSSGAPLDVFEEILTKYQEPCRFYHNLEHLRSGFEVLDRHFKSTSTGQVELAFWYHDFEYDPRATDNESKSAGVASDRITKVLQIPLNFAIEVGKLILATKYTASPSTDQAKILLDIDLSILGEAPAVFDQYELNIRKEYSWVPEVDFRNGRREILQRFLKPTIYNTPEMRSSLYEMRARENLQRSIENLGSTDLAHVIKPVKA